MVEQIPAVMSFSYVEVEYLDKKWRWIICFTVDRCIEFQMSEILWWLVGGADQLLGNF
jgi:hypothetical protein